MLEKLLPRLARLIALMIAAFSRHVPNTHEPLQVAAATVTPVSRAIMERIRGRWVELSAVDAAVSLGATSNVTAQGPLVLQPLSVPIERLIGPADQLFHVGNGTDTATLVIAWREDSPRVAKLGSDTGADCG